MARLHRQDRVLVPRLPAQANELERRLDHARIAESIQDPVGQRPMVRADARDPSSRARGERSGHFRDARLLGVLASLLARIMKRFESAKFRGDRIFSTCSTAAIAAAGLSGCRPPGAPMPASARIGQVARIGHGGDGDAHDRTPHSRQRDDLRHGRLGVCGGGWSSTAPAGVIAPTGVADRDNAGRAPAVEERLGVESGTLEAPFCTSPGREPHLTGNLHPPSGERSTRGRPAGEAE
jgi:hypothetical protein